MILYHFPTSPYARRVRLALSWKGVSVELRDARADPVHAEALRALNPLHTVPTLIDGTQVLIDSAAIGSYLEHALPSPPLWPDDRTRAHQVIALCDGAITNTVDLGLRYAPLDDHPRFAEVRERFVGRAQRALDALQAFASDHHPLCGRWSIADMALITTVIWFETMPERVKVFPPARKMLELGVQLPASLSRWADAHRARADVLAL